MSRTLAGFAMALACAVALNAQDSKTKTKVDIKGDDAKTVKYTGCVATGTETRSYVLANVLPVGSSTSTQVGTTGTTTTTTTTYALVPSEKVELQEHVGHKVEVTGVMIPAGDSKVETKTKIDNEKGPDTTIKEKTKNENAMPQFRVISVKKVSDRC
jgi:hypothetical protein